MKKLIISCDDLGISKEANLGIQECLDKGMATSSSIIANGRFYNHALENVINKTPNNFYGLHLNLTEGKALNKNSRNIICDKNNEFKISAKKYFLLNFYRSNNNLKSAVYIVDMQIEIYKKTNKKYIRSCRNFIPGIR